MLWGNGERKESMSNFREIAQEMARNLRYEEHCEDGMGSLIIRGLSFPENTNFSPLDKIWSSARKRNAERYGVYTTAIFWQSNKEGEIFGEFYPNHATIDEQDIELHLARFEDTFSMQIITFMEAIEAFLTDEEHGYVAYCTLVDTYGPDVPAEKCGTIVETFLRKIGLKTPADDAEKARRQRLSKKILKEKLTDFASLMGLIDWYED